MPVGYIIPRKPNRPEELTKVLVGCKKCRKSWFEELMRSPDSPCINGPSYIYDACSECPIDIIGMAELVCNLTGTIPQKTCSLAALKSTIEDLNNIGRYKKVDINLEKALNKATKYLKD